jgi:hypothetical protein
LHGVAAPFAMVREGLFGRLPAQAKGWLRLENA